MISFRQAFVLVSILVAGCVGKPVVPPSRPPLVKPASPPLPVGPKAEGEDSVLTPGSWTYTKDARGGLASYGTAGSSAALSIRCDTTARRIYVSRPGSVAARMTLRGTTGAGAYDGKLAAGVVSAELLPTDPQLDALAFSRGRFVVGMGGAPDVVVPSWPEVTRVIEDCRG
jgi:hypothetical protein